MESTNNDDVTESESIRQNNHSAQEVTPEVSPRVERAIESVGGRDRHGN